MKNFLMLGLAVMMLFTVVACHGQVNKNKSSVIVDASKVTVYYFHFSRRCNTCVSVEGNAKLAVESLYSTQVKAGDYVFQGVNLDDSESKALAEKLGVGGQSLLVVMGDKKVDITGMGFMYANDLEKMKMEIKKAVDGLAL